MDVVLSVTGLVLLLPLLIVIALSVKLTSEGPVLFRQTRVGRFGAPFELLKFRSMRAGEGGPLVTASGDSRITSIGRVLRRLKLDELPQLVNVLRGDMSLVGPRPEVPFYVEQYPADLKAKILSVRPGITDQASLSFLDEERILAASDDPERTYVQEILPRKLAVYSGYVDELSLSLDIRILVMTLAALARRPRADARDERT